MWLKWGEGGNETECSAAQRNVAAVAGNIRKKHSGRYQKGR